MAAEQYLTVPAIYERHQGMWDSAYTMPESSDIAMALIRHKVLDSRRQNGKAVQHISLPKPMAFPACKGNLGKMQK